MAARGFTLIGVLVYLAITAIVLAALSGILIASLRTVALVRSEQNLVQSDRVIERHVRQRLEEARLVTVPASGSSATLTVDSPDAASNPVVFAHSGTVLTMKLGTTAAASLTPASVRVTTFQATRLTGSPASILVTWTLQANAGASLLNRASSHTFTLRYE